MAEEYKLQAKDWSEPKILIQSMIDANEPRFHESDLPMFYGIIKNLFPDFHIEEIQNLKLRHIIETKLNDRGLHP